jgi:FkbM family methyltransferase
MVGAVKIAIQGVANRFGYQILRRDAGVDLSDPYQEQLRIAGPGAKVIFEVGAADGRDCSRFLELFPQSRVFAFEPIPESFAKVAARAAQSPRLAAFNVALSDQPGTAHFHLSNWVDASSLLKPKRTGSSFDAYQASSTQIKVRVDTIDAVCKRESVTHIDLLKMDAQGAEQRILAGASEMLARGAIDIVFTEVHFMESYEGAARFDQIMSALVGHGFHFHSFYGINHNHQGRATWADALFVHDRIAY